jgi:hypothetical protein
MGVMLELFLSLQTIYHLLLTNNAMRYTRLRGLTRVTQWVRLKFAAMNLKKLARWLDKSPFASRYWTFLHFLKADFRPCFAC